MVPIWTLFRSIVAREQSGQAWLYLDCLKDEVAESRASVKQDRLCGRPSCLRILCGLVSLETETRGTTNGIDSVTMLNNSPSKLRFCDNPTNVA